VPDLAFRLSWLGTAGMLAKAVGTVNAKVPAIFDNSIVLSYFAGDPK